MESERRSVRFLGTTDDVTTCECCGKKDLKSTVAISIDDGDAMYFGVTCAAHALRRDARHVRGESRKADRAREAAEAKARQDARDAIDAPWFAFLATNGTGSDVFRQIQSLGGYAAARARFNAERAQ